MSSSIDKIQISGPTLASLLHRLTTSSGDIDGILFGHVITTTPSTLSDTTTPTTTTTTITITSFFSSPSSSTFYTPSGHLLKPTLTSLTTNQPPLIGWFSGRRKTHLRPSMRESNVTSNLAKYIQKDHDLKPCIFLLLTTPFYDNLIHTHDYKVFSFTNDVFEVKGLDVVNLGPGFRGHYGHFEPMSLFPHLGFSVKGLAIESMVEDGGESEGDGVQKFRDLCDGSGFDIGRLKRLLGEQASGYTAELEEMYSNMIKKMNDLAKLVEQSSAKVLQQENHNMKLRYKVAGLE